MSLGIYLHIPFCKQKCLYCDFNSYAGKECLMEEYCDALKQEIKTFSPMEKVDTIYFGGGTPTVMGAEQLSDLLDVITSHFSLDSDCEITAECNPGTIDKSGLCKLHQAGFNRLSIGLQATDDAVLKQLGRIHSYQDFQDCFKAAREVGFANLSLDLMYGLPGQTPEKWRKTLYETVAFSPEHLSCYGLKIEDGTPFAQMELSLPTDDVVREMYDDCVAILQEAGYVRYEISNFAKPGQESRHNCRYWRYRDFIGFGAGAYSCVQGKRYYNLSDIADYCKAIYENGKAVEEEIPLSLGEQMSEFCFLGLRMGEGICEREFRQRFGRELAEVFGEVLNKNLSRKTMEYLDGRYRIVPDFFYVSNGISADFV